MGNCCSTPEDQFENLDSGRHGDTANQNLYVSGSQSNAHPVNQEQINPTLDNRRSEERPLPDVPVIDLPEQGDIFGGPVVDLKQTYMTLPGDLLTNNLDSTYLRPKQSKWEPRLIVTSIDFGTTFSGFSYATKTDYDKDPNKVLNFLFSNGTVTTTKAPTVVLFKPDKTFYKFGYDAERFYCENEKQVDLSEYYYFKHFKMELYKNKRLGRDTQLKDVTGTKSLPAIDVFSAVIRFFKEQLVAKLLEEGYKDTDIFYVLTIPAIWNLKAKQFMRLAAEKAGISENGLAIALEPEAASLTCRYESRCTSKLLNEGKQYLVVDAGGGTVDITAHEILPDRSLKELHSAEGGSWGGIKVNEKFEEFILEVFGSNVVNKIKHKAPGDWIDLLSEFERKKCYHTNLGKSEVWVVMRFPTVFRQFLEEEKNMKLEDYIKDNFNDNELKVVPDKLKISIIRFQKFFEECVDAIIKLTENVLNSEKLKLVDTILIVGGFAKSPILVEALKEHFKKFEVLKPENPDTAVMSGAVMFGFHPEMVQSRVCRYTYGIAKQEPFIEDQHPAHKRRCVEGKYFCDDLFDKHVERGQTLELGVFLPAKEYSCVVREQTMVGLELYASTEENPLFITDDSCEHIGIMEITLAPSKEDHSGAILVSMNISGTEIEIQAQEKHTNTVTKTRCNFLG